LRGTGSLGAVFDVGAQPALFSATTVCAGHFLNHRPSNALLEFKLLNTQLQYARTEFVSLNPHRCLRIANKEYPATPSAEDRCMVEGRALTTPALQDALFPILSPCRAVG
jgi:hypothetical protein